MKIKGLEKETNARKLSNPQDGDESRQEWETMSWSPEYRREMHRHQVAGNNKNTNSTGDDQTK